MQRFYSAVLSVITANFNSSVGHEIAPEFRQRRMTDTRIPAPAEMSGNRSRRGES